VPPVIAIGNKNGETLRDRRIGRDPGHNTPVAGSITALSGPAIRLKLKRIAITYQWRQV
jgi:hypothetical protein